MATLGVHMGFTFSQGGIDFLLFNVLNPNSQKWWLVLVLGPIYAGIYYVVFRAVIRGLDLKTPGREDGGGGGAGSAAAARPAGAAATAGAGQVRQAALVRGLRRPRQHERARRLHHPAAGGGEGPGQGGPEARSRRWARPAWWWSATACRRSSARCPRT